LIVRRSSFGIRRSLFVVRRSSFGMARTRMRLERRRLACHIAASADVSLCIVESPSLTPSEASAWQASRLRSSRIRRLPRTTNNEPPTTIKKEILRNLTPFRKNVKQNALVYAFEAGAYET